jgi:hypothetical protein
VRLDADMLEVLTLSKEVVLGVGLLLDIAIEAAGVGVLRRAVNVVLLLGINMLLSIEAARTAVNLVALWLSEVNH